MNRTLAHKDVQLEAFLPLIGLPMRLQILNPDPQRAPEVDVAGQLQAVLLENSSIKFVFYNREFDVPFGAEYALQAF